jgi:hypothetical protein
MYIQVSVTNLNFIPTYVLEGNVMMYYPDSSGRHRFLGTGKLGGFYMYYGVNRIQVTKKRESRMDVHKHTRL